MRQLDELKRYFTPLPDTEVILAFQGSFSQDIIVSLGEMLKNEISGISTSVVVNRIFGIFVEMAQNVMHHSMEKRENNNGFSPGKGSIIIGQAHDSFMIVTSNLIPATAMDDINHRIKELNQMDKISLKNTYLIKRRHHDRGGLPGAGLGLYDIARRSTQPLSVGFLPEGMGKVRFFLRVMIPG